FRVFVLAWDATRPAGLGGGTAPTVAADLGHERSRAPRDGRTGPADRGREPVALLPTPTTQPTTGNGYARNLGGEVRDLLPTPSVADVEGGRKHRSGARSDELLLNGIAHEQAFGQYAPAIARWETALGRPAPAPTEPTGKGCAHRLSPRFVEWMMGLPDGWVTDTDTTRNEQLKALGNGVVPQQAAAALRHMLSLRTGVAA